MIKKVCGLVVCLSVLSAFVTGCSSFQDEYKPLYQVKPEVEKVEE